jgi:hypothetical protein
MVIRDMEYLHPRVRTTFKVLARELREAHEARTTQTLFLPFETYRTPERQAQLKAQSKMVTAAGPWSSAHQFGLAVDFVPFVDGKWSWADGHDYRFLRAAAERLGLKNGFSWGDLVHVEHPVFESVKAAMRF